MDLPLAKYPLLRTKTLEETWEAFNRLYCRTEITCPNPPASIQWHANGISLGNIRIVAGDISHDIALSTKMGLDAVVLTIGRKRTKTFGTYRQHRQEFFVTNEQGVVLMPRRPILLHLPGGFSSLTVRLDYAALTDMLYALSGTYSAKPLEFDAVFDKRTPNGSEIFRLLDFIIQTLECDPSPLAHPLVLGNLQNAFLMGFLHAQPHNHHQLLEKDVATPSARAVQTAEAYLDANADKPVSMAELQAVTGMSVRSIQAGFKARRGCSPMEFLRERRLIMAQQRLQKATLGTKVAEVAYSCGFGHLGRFSRDYHKRFGEKPSETLDRTLQANHGPLGRTVLDALTRSRP